MNNLRITLIQTALHWENIEANLSMFSEKVEYIKEQTDLIILPEMFSTGFSMKADMLAEEMHNSKAISWMKKAAQERKCAVTGSLMMRSGEEFFNRLIWVHPDGIIQHYDKRHLFGLSKEEEVYSPGQELLMVELNGWKIRPLICYDLRFPVWSRNGATEPYDLLLYVANWPERRVYAWKHLLVARAIENQCYVAGLNRVGNDGTDIYHSGDSMVLDPLGNTLYHKEHDEDICTIELSYEELQKVRTNLPFLKDADSFIINPKTRIQGH
jgi:predicted amidohydrolase